MIQAGRTNIKDDFIKLVSIDDESSNKQKSERELSDIGLASDTAIKNYNPDLEVKKGGDD